MKRERERDSSEIETATCSSKQKPSMGSPPGPGLTIVDISQFDHTPFYCEENVYQLCKKLCAYGIAEAEASDLFVVLISNEKKQIPMWHQKASGRADGVILWDYHVICVQKKEGNLPYLVWDIDSSLPFPCPLGTYVSESIRPSFQLFREYLRFFRIVPAPKFLQFFASDRRHMKDSAGNWIQQPPAYDPIVAEDGTTHNLNEYLEMHAAEVVTDIKPDLVDTVLSERMGILVNESQFEEFFSVMSSSTTR